MPRNEGEKQSYHIYINWMNWVQYFKLNFTHHLAVVVVILSLCPWIPISSQKVKFKNIHIHPAKKQWFYIFAAIIMVKWFYRNCIHLLATVCNSTAVGYFFLFLFDYLNKKAFFSFCISVWIINVFLLVSRNSTLFR